MKRNEEVKHIAETIYGYMQEAYDDGFEDGAKSRQECSWEKGVRDAWECAIHTLDMLGKDTDIPRNERAVMRAIAHTFEHSDAVEFTRSFVEMKNTIGDVKFSKEPIMKIIKVTISEDEK